MTETELRASIKRGPSGGYLFWGEEDYLKRHYLSEMRNAALSECPPGLEEMNRIALSAEDGDFGALAEAIATPPVMTTKKIVEFAPPAMGSWREKERKAFLASLQGLQDAADTVLVVVAARGALDAGTPKRPSAFFRSLSALLNPVEFPLQTGARLRRWAERHFADAGLEIDPNACAFLLARCAPDMTGLASEIDKLICYEKARGAAQVSREDVERVSSPGMREDAFALANAVLAGDRTAAYTALDAYRKRREEPAAVLAALSRVMSDLLTVAMLAESGAEKAEIARALKMHEYKAMLYIRSAADFGSSRLAAALERCRAADRLTKNASLEYIPLERFIGTLPRGTSARG